MIYSGLQTAKKIIRVKSQANECASVSAAQGKLLHKETTEMLQNWSIIVCKEQKYQGWITGKWMSQCFCGARKTFSQGLNRKCYNLIDLLWFINEKRHQG